jgi:hypothetical protein
MELLLVQLAIVSVNGCNGIEVTNTYSGKTFGYPEHNCCACGKGKYTNYENNLFTGQTTWATNRLQQCQKQTTSNTLIYL